MFKGIGRKLIRLYDVMKPEPDVYEDLLEKERRLKDEAILAKDEAERLMEKAKKVEQLVQALPTIAAEASAAVTAAKAAKRIVEIELQDAKDSGVLDLEVQEDPQLVEQFVQMYLSKKVGP